MNMIMNAFLRNHFLNMNLMDSEIKYDELVLESEDEDELEGKEEYDDW